MAKRVKPKIVDTDCFPIEPDGVAIFEYKKLPHPDIVKLHGELSLDLGWYRVAGDRVLFVETYSATYLQWDLIAFIKHREDGPAVIWREGNVRYEWYINGKRVEPFGTE